MERRRRNFVATACVIATLLVGGCDDGNDDDPVPPEATDAPTLDRIDGPAVVDPSYDPFAVPDPTTGG